MELQLKNIGMIKEANVKIDGLTVIAGENDTGKSTVGKSLFMFLKTYNFMFNDILKLVKKTGSKKIENFSTNVQKEINEHLNFPKLIFQELISGTEFSLLENGKKILDLSVNNQNHIVPNGEIHMEHTEIAQLSPIIIETPLVWNFTDFFRDIAQIESQMNIKLDYPYLMKDLNFKLHIKSASNGLDIKEKVTNLMGGEFKKDEMGRYYFDKKGQRIELVNTATGIKYFGIFQVLSQNNYLNENTVLVLDEPEVHLHPKWQLEMAKIIVELVKNGVKIVVNSHSPYMIEALQRYGKKSKIDMDFYLAENGIIDKIDNNNSATLSKIFEKLSEPFDIFDEMDSETLRNG